MRAHWLQAGRSRAARRATRRGRLPVLGAVLLAALTAVAGLPMAGLATAGASVPTQTTSPPQDSAEPTDTTTTGETDEGEVDGGEAQGGEAVQTGLVQAQSTETLTAGSVTRTGVTLTISSTHTAAWYYRRSPSDLGPCSAQVAANAAATLTDLTPATSYTFKAYSDAACATEITSDSTDAEFTTPGLVLSSHDLTVKEGSSATYTVKLATEPGQNVTVTAARATDRYSGLTIDTDSLTSGNQSTLTFTTNNWSTAQTVTVSVAANSGSYTDGFVANASVVHEASSSDAVYSGAAAANAVTVVDSADAALSVSSVTATGAQLAISNEAGRWHYRTFASLGDEGACTAVTAGTSSVALINLMPGTDYIVRAYHNSTCTSPLTRNRRNVEFTTPGVALSARRLVVPEGSSVSYDARLATEPTGAVTVTIARTGTDNDLTVDTDLGTSGDQNILTFNATNWSTPQTVTVSAAQETGSTDKAYGTATFSHTAAGSGYATAGTDLAVTEGDDDVCNSNSGAVTPHGGGADIVQECNTLLAARAMLVGSGGSTAIDNWATTLDMEDWTGISVSTSNRVQSVQLSSKGLTGSVPNTLGDLAGLKQLGLSYNELSGPIPPQLGDLTKLELLYMHGNLLSGPVPPQLGDLTKLEHLGLAGNSLSGAIPAQIGNLAALETLQLQSNLLSGAIPAQIGNLAALETLKLQSNLLSGAIPAQIGNLAALETLGLSVNTLSGQIPTQLGNLANLGVLDLDENALSGPIPSELGNLTNLSSLHLGGNALSGPIPAQLANLTGLGILGLGANALSRPIPSWLGNLTELTFLSLGDNAMSGPIPSQLGNLTKLKNLYLWSLGLSGPVPSWLGSLTELKYLYLDDNQLSGQIPSQLGNLTGLATLRLGDNWLTGCLPANLLRFLADLWDSETQRDGTTPAVCDGIVLSDAQPSVSEGRTATYTVQLSRRPQANVSVSLTRNGDSDITVSPTTLNFTTSNWDTTQTVTLTAAEDNNDAADGTTTITHTASSSDNNYNSKTATATATEQDNEPSLSVDSVTATTAHIDTSNISGTWYYRQTAPTSGTCTSTLNTSIVVRTLTPGTSYTYKAYGDTDGDGDCDSTDELTTDASDANFTTDSGVVTSASAVVAPEGSRGTFTVNLATAPTQTVTVDLTGGATGDASLTFSPTSLTFTSGNSGTWSTPQTVTVTAAQDADTTHGTKRLTLTSSSSDTVYDSKSATVDAVESDDDPALSASAVTATTAVLTFANHGGFWYLKQGTSGNCTLQGAAHTVRLQGLTAATAYTYKAYSDSACTTANELTSNTTDARFTTTGDAVLMPKTLTVSEGSSGTYTIALGSQPAQTVTVRPAVTGDSDVTVSPATLTFTSNNWSSAQTVTVRAAQDTDAADGIATITHTATSQDPNYSNKSLGSVTVTEDDDETVSLEASGITGTTATLTVGLHIGVWHYRQTAPFGGPCSAQIAANTTTAVLSGLAPATGYTFKAYSNPSCSTELTTDATDADFTTTGLVVSSHDLVATEGGNASTYTVKLATEPKQNVTVAVAKATNGSNRFRGLSVDTDTGTTGKQSTLTFTRQNWSTAQTVTYSVTSSTFNNPYGVGLDASASITHTASSTDAGYADANAAVALTVIDSNAPVLTPSSITATGATLAISGWTNKKWYYLMPPNRLGTCTEVAANASATLSTLTAGTSYSFDAYSDAACASSITGRYRGAQFRTPGIMLSAANLVAKEGTTATYTVRLATPTASNVTVNVARAAGGDVNLTASPATLTFTSQNWSSPQTVTVTAGTDTDKLNGTATFNHTATGYTTASLAVTESDNVCSGTAAVNNATTGGLVDDCNTLFAAKATLAGGSTAIDNWATTLAIGSWTGINLSNNRVVHIGLINSGLKGSVPPTLGDLDALEWLYLNGNELTGPIPAELGSLTKLKSLWLSANALTGTIPAQLGNLAELEWLALQRNALSGSVPPELGNLAKLKNLFLNQNALSGTIPLSFVGLTALEGLWLAENTVSGPIPTQLGDLSELTDLHLDQNALSGPIPTQLASLTQLERLYLHDNALSGPVPEQLGSLTELKSLYASFNALSGQIPKQFGNLTDLENLELGENALSGPIPAQLANLTKLERLHLNNNWLSGPIPTRLGQLAGLRSLDLNDNALSGQIPAELAELNELTWLRLSRNLLSGQIPRQIGNLAKLQDLWLHVNQLTGPIPAQLGNLTNLTAIYLNSNWLSGCVPANLLRFTSQASSFPQYNGRSLAVCKGIVVSDAHPSVGEGSTADYTVRLSAMPSANVTVDVATGGDTSITAGTTQLTFATNNWETAQTVRLTAAADADATDGATTITHTATGGGYDSLIATVVATEADDEPSLTASNVTATTATLTIANRTTAWHYKHTTPASGTCSEAVAAGTATADLTGLEPGTSYTFKAYSDSSCNSNTALTPSTGDAHFTTGSGVQTSSSAVVVPEGGAATFTVSLAKKPTGTVTVSLAADQPGGGNSPVRVAPRTLTFTAATYSTAQTVTVSTWQEPSTVDRTGRVALTASSTDAVYDGVVTTVAATVSDDDPWLSASAVTADSAALTLENHVGDWYLGAPGHCSERGDLRTVRIGGLAIGTSYTYKAYSDSSCTAELTTDATDAAFTTDSFAVLSSRDMAVTEGSSVTYEVRLSTAPASNVTVTVGTVTDAQDLTDVLSGLTVDTDSINSGDQDTLTFTPTTWWRPKKVTVSVEANTFGRVGSTVHAAMAGITHTAASNDAKFEGKSTAAALTVTDDAAPKLTASAVDANSATLNISDWNGPWYYGLHPNPDEPCPTVLANTSSVDLDGLKPGTHYRYKAYSSPTCIGELTSRLRDVEFTTPGVTLSATRLVVPEGTSVAYTARLATRPAGSVTVTVGRSTNADDDLTVDTDPRTPGNQNTLEFNAVNWDTPQTVTVSAAQEIDSTDKAYGAATFSHTAAGSGYATAGTDLLVTEGDDDVCQGTTAVGGSNVTSGGIVDDCNTLLAAKAMLAGTSTAIDNWATGTAIGSWTGIEALGTVGRAAGLTLEQRDLSGSIPNTLGDLTALEHLGLEGNKLSGPIPESLGNRDLTRLSSIRLSSNRLSGPIPASLGDLSFLPDLDLSHNRLSGPIPPQLGKLHAITPYPLRLGGNALSGPIPGELGRLRGIPVLELSDNDLSGPIPAALGNLTALAELSLAGNALSGPVPAELGDLAAVSDLNLTGNYLSGTIPARLSSLRSLQRLYLGWNTLTGPIPSQLGSLSSLEYLDLSDNALTGPIPSQLGNLASLGTLDLSDNALTGSIPSQLGNLSELASLDLEYNSLSGPIPSQLGNLTELWELWLGWNDLTGSIPSQLGNLTELVQGLGLHDNALSGPIPPQLGNLTQLVHFRLQNNGLSGSIPSQLGNLTELRSFLLQKNKLTGSIPAELGNLTDVEPGWFNVADNDLNVFSNSEPNCIPANLQKFLAHNIERFRQTDGSDPKLCKGIVLSDAHPNVPEGSFVDYDVQLSTEPAGDVTVTVSASTSTSTGVGTSTSAEAEATTGTVRTAADNDITIDTDPKQSGVQTTPLTFTTTNWNVAQTVRLIAAQDTDATAGQATITHTASSNITDPTDPTKNYDGLSTVAAASEDEDDVGLFASKVTHSSAKLTITEHTGEWWYQRSSPAGGTCTAAGAGDTSTVTGLSSNRSYVFKAYGDGDGDCDSTDELTTDDTDAHFTTSSAPSSPGGGTGGGGGGGGGGGATRAKSIRLSGASRYETATDVADQFVSVVEDPPDGGAGQQVDTVIVASGEAFPDALAASALARTLGAPVVLTPKKVLDPAVKAFITRHRISKVVIVGGAAAVSDHVEDTLRGLSGIDSVTRHFGPDRYSTAAVIAEAAGTPGNLCGSSAPTVIVTTGQNFPDALVAGPLAYRGRHPIVLTASDRLPKATANYLRSSGARQVIIVGGLAAVSSDVVDAIKALGLSTSRVSGADRADTSVQFARRFNALSGTGCYRRDTVGLATGWAFPDALAAAALLGHYGAPLLLTNPAAIPQDLVDYAASGRLTPDLDQPPIVTIGGRKAVPSNHPIKLLAALPR